MTRVRVWWAARRAYRRGLCSWCRQPMLDTPAVTAAGRRVHPRCLGVAEDFDREGAVW